MLSRRQVLVAAVAGGLTAACGRPGEEHRTDVSDRTVLPSRRTVDVRSFGAVGDGHTDDTEAIERGLAALAPGTALRFPAGGTFTHSRTLVVRSHDVTLTGGGRLLATAEATSALQLDADRVAVQDLILSIASTTQRWSTPDQHKLYLGPRRGIVVQDVTIDGSAAAGVFCYGTSHFTLDRVRVANTRADGIHMTNGAHDGSVRSPHTSHTGDDGVAVVSYASDEQACEHIVVDRPTVSGTSGGRGISVVGGSFVDYNDIDVSASNAAGVYVACEGGSFVTRPTSNVRITSGSVSGANTNPQIDHGAVLVYSGRPGAGVSDVHIAGLTVTGTRPGASRQIGVVADSAACATSDISFAHLRLARSPTPYQGDAPDADVRLSGVRAAGAIVSV